MVEAAFGTCERRVPRFSCVGLGERGETFAEYRILRGMGIQLFQGDLFVRPHWKHCRRWMRRRGIYWSPLRNSWRVPGHRYLPACVCIGSCRKKSTIAWLASGPRGSV